MLKSCITCGKRTKSYAEFPCPECGSKIVRCPHCRKISLPYSCPACGRAGP
ncbi:MAG: zinc finger domain-containing protein [Candidatus Micrarchaeota archaeon]|nr:zinc finger domain-containing protein [Candidatus Micrarchaeota archaeon]